MHIHDAPLSKFALDALHDSERKRAVDDHEDVAVVESRVTVDPEVLTCR